MAEFFPDKNTIKLLRIPFSLFLMPVFLLTVSQSDALTFFPVAASFLIIHLLIYPASNGYNSYIDKDESSIGGLEKPPVPTIKLFYITIFLDLLALILSVLVINIYFALCVLLYILASRAYSSKQIRLKKYPVIGFLTVMLFQGAFTYYMAYTGINNIILSFSAENIFLLTACSFQIAGAYPLTQIYQHNEDLKNGDITLSYKLGYTGTFIFTAFMFVLCNLFYYLYFRAIHKMNSFFILQLFFIPTLAYFFWWFNKVRVNNLAANFKNTMRMNLIASVSMSACFSFFIILKYIL
jgi:1,4-dihydroxy-2-naphthoate octaprenyltransferase